MAPDPYARYLQQADELFASGDIVRAGQIWQAVLKQVPDHGIARAGLLKVKAALEAQAAKEAAREAEAAEGAASETHRRVTDSAVDIPALVVPGVPEAASAPSAPASQITAPVPMPEPPPEIPAPPSQPQVEMVSIPDSEPSAPAATAPATAMDEDTQDKLLREGCTLYDMGQTEDALRKWDQLLAAVPDHAMAIQYAQGARRELGLPLDGSVSVPATVHPVTQEVPLYNADEEAADKLLREGCLLYDMGLPTEAIGKWEQAIKLAPHRADIQSFIDNAQKDLAEPQETAPAPAAPAPSPADEKVRHGDHLLNLQRVEEAAFSYQQALDLDPNHQGAKAGLQRCRVAQGNASRPVPSPRSTGPLRIEMDRPDPEPELAPEPSPTPEPAQPPAALTKPAPAPREGLKIKSPVALDPAQIPDWAKNPKLWIASAGGLLVLVLGTLWYRSAARDSQLKSDVDAAHRAAVAKAAKDAEVPSLAETPASILSEAKQALGEGDAVRAYFRARTLVKRDPSDGAAAQLLSQAKAALSSSGLIGATSAEYQQHLKEGDLDQAGKVMDALLRGNPDDPTLRLQALRLTLRLAEDHASQERWADAKDDLLRGRALDPDDPTWSARLTLLTKIQAMPKSDRPLWIALLG